MLSIDQQVFISLNEHVLIPFYGWWQLVVCMFSFMALMAIWWHLGRKQQDVGQVWLALSVLCWSLSGAVELYYSSKINTITPNAMQAWKNGTLSAASWLEQTDQLKYQLSGWRSIFSLFNSFFILLALSWFRYIPKKLEPIIKSKYWIYICGLPFIFSLLPTFRKLFLASQPTLISELDVYYAILTLAFLGYTLWTSFENRRLKILAWLSLIFIMITFVAQVFKLSNSPTEALLFSAIFKSALIMIFFALALSWVKELMENVIPPSELLSLSLTRNKNDEGKFSHQVHIKGLPGDGGRSVRLTPALYELLTSFAEKRKSDLNGWLEVKPKNATRNRTYDIQDYNQIKRLIHALLDGLFGKGNWTRNKHEEPLKEALFEWSQDRDRKIRLRLPKSNIHISH